MLAPLSVFFLLSLAWTKHTVHLPSHILRASAVSAGLRNWRTLTCEKPIGKELSASRVKLIASARLGGSDLPMQAGKEKSFNLNVTQVQGW